MLKRFFDILLSGIGLIALAPLFVVTAACILVFLGSPILFIQQRPGYRGEPFYIYKFRTMKDLRDSEGDLLPDDQRMSGFGTWLRRTSIDELPELWNVLKGDMSLVGPRPLLMQYLSLYNDEQRRRHEVRPGITGWAQVNGRNAIEWEQRFKLDVWYVNNSSFSLDLKILVLTLIKVLRADDISSKSHVTMEPFKGNKITE